MKTREQPHTIVPCPHPTGRASRHLEPSADGLAEAKAWLRRQLGWERRLAALRDAPADGRVVTEPAGHARSEAA